MPITSQEKELVVQSFLILSSDIDRTAEIFYGRLFKTLPDASPLFEGTDMREQGRILMRMLDSSVETLSHPDQLREKMTVLGKRHVGYGVEKAHYTSFGEALLWTVEEVLGDEYAPEIGVAWAKAFQMLADIAIAAAEA
jgi:hemoglobin-like flavoprotein